MTDPGFSDLLSLVQTCAILVALVTTLHFSRRQVHAYTVDLDTRVLNDLDEKMHQIGQVFLERPEPIRTIYASPESIGRDVPFAYYVLFFGAHIHHLRERGILGDNEWTGWLRWMRNAFQYGTLGKDWTDGHMGEWFDPSFRGFVEGRLLLRTASRA
jgi:hypothetical protein